MSPISVNRAENTPGDVYGNPFVGPVDHTAQISVDLTALTDDEIDAEGWLKPGVPLTQAGILVAAGAVFGVTIEPLQVASGNTAPEIAALATDYQVAVGTVGQVNRAVVEDNLGRVLTAAEIAGFGLAGSTLKLLA